MAGDWIKMTHALPDKPEVLAIAGKAGLNRFDVVGRLFILWRWFDVHTIDGNAVGVTQVTLEECLFGYGANVGFVAAVVSVGWLDLREDGIGVVKFDEHISESAKVRAQTAKRVAKSKSNAKGNAEGNAPPVTKTVPREEKRREEKNTPKGDHPGFARFWLTWPKTDRKEAKGKCLEAWVKSGAEAVADAVVAHVERLKTSPAWTKDNGQFVPAPLVYLNQRRWEGAEDEDAGQQHRGFV